MIDPFYTKLSEQFIVNYYTTYAYKRDDLPKFYENEAYIYRPSMATRSPVSLTQCRNNLSFSNDNDHVTVLNYVIFPTTNAIFSVSVYVSGRIDTADDHVFFFTQIFELHIYSSNPYGYAGNSIKAYVYRDSVVITDPALTPQKPSEYFDVVPPTPAATPQVELPSKENVEFVQQSSPQQPPAQQQPAQPQPQQQQPQPVPQNQSQPNQPQQEQQPKEYEGGNNQRGRGGFRGRGGNYGRGRARQQNSASKYGSAQNKSFNYQGAQHYGAAPKNTYSPPK